MGMHRQGFHPLLSRSVLTGVQIPNEQEGKHMETPTFESYPWWMVLYSAPRGTPERVAQAYSSEQKPPGFAGGL